MAAQFCWTCRQRGKIFREEGDGGTVEYMQLAVSEIRDRSNSKKGLCDICGEPVETIGQTVRMGCVMASIKVFQTIIAVVAVLIMIAVSLVVIAAVAAYFM